MESIRKQQAKRQIEWCRDDIQFDNKMLGGWNPLFERHKKKCHEGKEDSNCETCRLWKEVIQNAKDDIVEQKKQIREVLRGER